jgi:hypothetical protein
MSLSLGGQDTTWAQTRRVIEDYSSEVLGVFTGSGGDDTDRLEAAIASLAAKGRPGNLKLFGEVLVTRTIDGFALGNAPECTDGYFKAAPGFTADTAVLKFGDKTTETPWNGCVSKIHVDSGGQHLIGVDISYVFSGGNTIGTIWSLKSSYVPVRVDGGYGLVVGNYRLTSPALLSGDLVNAGTDSIALLVNTSDCKFLGGTSFGQFIGVKNMAANNVFSSLQPFGVYEKAGVPQSCPMGIGFWNEGEGSVFEGCMADSPSLVDYTQAASLTNGGYGFVNRGFGFRARLTDCWTFVPDRAVFGETLPSAKLVGVRLDQAATVIGGEFVDQGGSMASRYSGTQLDLSMVLSRAETRFYSAIQPKFNRKPYLARGLEIQTITQDADEQADTDGAISFAMSDDKYLTIKANYGGTKKDIRLPRYQKGDSAAETVLAALLGAGDAGYLFYNTTLGKLRVWSGAAFGDV